MLFGMMIQATLRFDLSLSEEANGLRESACTIARRVAFLRAPLSCGTGSALMRSMTAWWAKQVPSTVAEPAAADALAGSAEPQAVRPRRTGERRIREDRRRTWRPRPKAFQITLRLSSARLPRRPRDGLQAANSKLQPSEKLQAPRSKPALSIH